jgi:methylmalonyl-CoA mutase
VFEAGALGPRIAAAALDRARARGDDLAGLELTVGCDPLGALARYGGLSVDLERAFAELAALFSAVPAVAPRVRLALVSSIHYADAGATASEELALLIASGVELLDRLGAAGLSASTVAPRILFAMSVGRDLFGELAKLRAARLLWARVVLALGGDAQAGAAALHVEGAWRELTRVDPWVNLIRGAAAGLVGALGGVESAATHAFTAVDGPDEDARRWAVNTQLILREEAHLGRALDPAGGAWYVEALTDQLARAAWTRVRELLAAGGRRGGAAQRGDPGRAWPIRRPAQAQAAAQVREPLTGVSRFPALDEALPPVAPRRAVGLRDPVDRSREREGAAERATPLPRARLAAGFEALRAEPPVVARLLVVGERAGLRARVDFVRGLLASGGIACPGDLVHADADAALADYVAAPAGLVVLCAADADYAALVAGLVAPLRASGAQVVALAGRPREEAPALRAAGVDLFLHLGCDVIAAIRALRDRLGAAR